MKTRSSIGDHKLSLYHFYFLLVNYLIKMTLRPDSWTFCYVYLWTAFYIFPNQLESVVHVRIWRLVPLSYKFFSSTNNVITANCVKSATSCQLTLSNQFFPNLRFSNSLTISSMLKMLPVNIFLRHRIMASGYLMNILPEE